MKTFNIDMATPDSGEIICEYSGEGDVSFPVNTPDMDTIMAFRRECVGMYQALGEKPDNADAFEAAYRMRVKLISLGIAGDLTDEQATVVLSKTGGINGPLIKELESRFGVSDIFNPAPAGGLDSELPT